MHLGEAAVKQLTLESGEGHDLSVVGSSLVLGSHLVRSR